MTVLVLMLVASLAVATSSGSVEPPERPTSDAAAAATTTTTTTTIEPRGQILCAHQGATANGGVLPNIIFPKCTASLNPSSLRNLVIHGMACTCDLSAVGVPKREDYHYTPGLGGHKFHTRIATFNEARKICNEEGAHLAVINSLAEEQILLDLFKAAGSTIRGTSQTHVALIGTHDLYHEGDWVTILGDSLHKTGFTKWSEQWGGQPDNGGGIQHCGALVNSGGMDDVHCDSSFAFFCEIPAIQAAY